MHPLLALTRPSEAAASAELRAWTSANAPAVGAALRVWPRAEVDALASLFAWHRVSEALLAPGLAAEPLARARDALLAALEAARTRTGRAPLEVALGRTLARFALPDVELRERVLALERAAHARAFASRAELAQHVARTAHSEARLYLRVTDHAGEREERLAYALANGLERATALSVARRVFAAQGRLVFPAADLAEHGVRVGALAGDPGSSASGPGLVALVADAVRDARAELARGWPLVRVLGARRGRALAFVLRWHAADLSALEARGFELPAERPPAGRVRFVLCAGAALFARAPRFL